MKRIIILFSLFMVITMFTGCSETATSDGVNDIHQLEVPEGFGFETTHLLNVVVTAPVAGTFKVTKENGAVIYKSFVDPDEGGFDGNILLSTNITSLYFHFKDEVIHRNVSPLQDCLHVFFTTSTRGDIRVDSDGDGVEDDEDDFPDDPELAYMIEYPTQDTTRCRTYGTIAYEDRWPSEGDYDFNDVIINYYIYECVSRWCETRQIYMYLYYSVDGAGFNNGLYFKLPYNSGGVVYYEYPHDSDQLDAWYDGDGEGNIILRIFEEAQVFMPDPPYFHNTEAEEPFTEPVYFQQIHIVLDDSDFPENPTIQDYPPYNPFLVIDQTPGREVHFANYYPSLDVDAAWFNTQHDTSDPIADRYYVTILDLPWGIHIPEMFDHPLERISIINAYPNFVNWVTSGGTTNTDWYDYPVPGTVYDYINQVNNIYD